MFIKQKVLLLNYSYEPLMIVNGKKAIILYLLDKVEMIEKSKYFINSLYIKVPIPHVIKLKSYIFLKRKSIALTRKNILKRDEEKCQYCGKRTIDMTIDHIIPKDKGGKDSWINLVAACKGCNFIKGNNLLKDLNMTLMKRPAKPSYLFNLQYYTKRHSSWDPYLFIKKEGA